MSELTEHVVLYCVGAIIGFVLGALVFALPGCYLEHEAAPCDAGDEASVGETQRYSTPRWSGMAGSPAVEGPAPFICPGPIVAGECYEDIKDVLTRGR